ncbi:MAG: hypothetical protein EOS20_18645 [Mesorhizobium sp.]|uniref:hypothetical protein n=1 Tax=Mesorhizobium sp. TaxID=1871066 RepID=UPI000FE7EE0B|nr:hypothetical protein [Mesorhizobium sp.]RWQ35525.1 MAG: hypothetical protein EOS20_18645 [Mesorhizobium sp.]RWQ38724.1 MAG: hypothetical protein EOS21_19500 [Mesorhizobium sp.]
MRFSRMLLFGCLAATLAAVTISVAVDISMVEPIPILASMALASLSVFVLMTPSIRIKSVHRFDEIQRHFRLFRLLWERGTPGDGKGYSNKLAVALWPKLFTLQRESPGEILIGLFGLRVHYSRSYGGTFG